MRFALLLPIVALAFLAALPARADESVGSCMFNLIGEPYRGQLLSAGSSNEAVDAIGPWVQSRTGADIEVIMTQCKLREDRVRPAASAMTAYGLRLWAENKLAAYYGADELDRFYRALPASRRTALTTSYELGKGFGPWDYEGLNAAMKPLLKSSMNASQEEALSEYLRARLTLDLLETVGLTR